MRQISTIYSLTESKKNCKKSDLHLDQFKFDLSMTVKIREFQCIDPDLSQAADTPKTWLNPEEYAGSHDFLPNSGD